MSIDFLNISKDRYTTKKYNSEKKIDKEKIEQLKEVLRLSPSSINSQPWQFTVVSDEKLKEQLANASYFNADRVTGASHLVVFNVIDDIPSFEKQIRENLPEGYVAYYDNVIKLKSEEDIKSWFARQVYISLGYFLAACASMGIDSTPMEGIDVNEYANILKLNGYKPLFAVAIGYRDEEDENQPVTTPKLRLPIEDVILSL